MKKITLLFSALCFSVGIFAQCPAGEGGQYPIDTVTVVNDGAIYYIEFCNYTTEFSVLDGLVIDDEYQFEIVDEELGTEKYLTIVDAADGTTVLDHGMSPFTWTATVTSININWSEDNACGSFEDCNLTSYVNVTMAPTPPTNDTCATAIPIDCDETLSGNTGLYGVTNTTGNFARDLWYVYSGVEGDITASLCGTAYDTNMLVFDACDGALIVENDDLCDLQSSVTFTADGSSSYYIVVDGYGFNDGAFDLSITCADTIPPPPNNECIDAEMLTFAVPSTGTTAGATEDVTHEKAPCDPFGTMADVWYTVEITEGRSEITINTTVTAPADQAFIAVYPNNCDALGDDALGCSNVGGDETLVVDGLVNGTYYIRVWSDGLTARTNQRVEGEFSIVVDATLSTTDFDNGLAFTYFPNPVKDNLSLKAQNNIDDVAVYNMLGQEVLRATPNTLNTELNMSELQSGAYFVKVSINGNTETVKIIKN